MVLFIFRIFYPKYKQMKMNRDSLKVSQVAIFTSLAVVGRLSMVILPNVSPVAPLTFISGYLGGGYTGFLVGSLTMVISDLFIGFGPWTIFTSLFMGIVGLIGGLVSYRIGSRTTLFLIIYLSVLIYDIGTSISTLALFGVPFQIALINLFMPVFILGIPYPMGPIHEFSSTILTIAILDILKRFRFVEVIKLGE